MLTVGTNSWVTIAEADSYIADMYSNTGWAAADKDKLLITAFRRIYTCPDFSIAKTSTNELVKWAQIELAFWLLKNNNDMQKREALQSMNITSVRIDDMSESYDKGFILPPIVKNMLKDFASGSHIGVIDREVENYI